MQSMIQPALSQWAREPQHQEWLAKVLSSRSGQLLMAALSEMAVPAEDFNTVDRIQSESLEKIAMHHCLVAGQQLALTNIRLLATPTTPVTELPHEGWESEPSE